MLSARGVSRASAILPSFHLKQFITFTNPVLIHKFLQCEILQRVLHGKSAFSGLTLNSFEPLASSAINDRVLASVGEIPSRHRSQVAQAV